MLSAPPDAPVLVVGGGLGALLLARRLRLHGIEVTVLEKNARFGGCNGRTDAGAPMICYAALGLEPGGALARLLQEAGAWPAQAPPRRLATVDHVVFPGLELALPGGLDDFQRCLAERFPQERHGLQQLCDDMAQVHAAIRDSAGLAPPQRRQQAMKLLQALSGPRYADYLQRHVGDPLLRRLLCVRAFSSSNAAVTMLAYLGKMLIDGLYALPDSGAGLTDALVACLRADAGCRLRTQAEVAGLLFDDAGRACGVRLRGGEHLYGSVVLDVEPAGLCRGGGGDAAMTRLAAALADASRPHRRSLGALCFVYTLAPDLGRALSRWRGVARCFHADDADPCDVLAAREAGALDTRNAKINLDFDAGGVARRAYVELDCAAAALPRPGADGAVHPALQALAQALPVQRLSSLQRDFADGITGVEILTPHAFAACTGHLDGASSGYVDGPPGPRAIDRVLGAHGLGLVGQWSAHGSGLSQLDVGALRACDALVRARLQTVPAA